MLHLLFLIVIGAVSLQTDWMGGSGVLGPASDWRTQYYKGDSVTAATPGQVSLVATEWDYSKWEKHIVESNWGIGSNHQGFMPADINKDGKKDLVAHTADKVVWYENLGDYTFATKHIIGPANDGFSVYLSVYPCDLDTDGDIDVLVATKGVGLGWYENQGSLWIWHIVDNGIGYHRVSSADVELDGDVDMIAVDNSSSQSHGDVYLFRNDGAQNFAKELIGNLFDDGWRVYPADFNGDGFPDIYSIGFNSNYVFLNDRTGHFTLSWSSNYWVDGDFDGAWAEDIDMDGDMDLVCGKQWDSGVKGFYALLNDGTGYNFDSTLLAEVSSGHYMDGAIAADIDLDGLPDIAGTYDEIGWFRQDPANPLTFSVYDVDTAAMSHNSHWVYVASLRCWECVPSMDILVTEKNAHIVYENRMLEAFADLGFLESSILELPDTSNIVEYFGYKACVPNDTALAFYWRIGSDSSDIVNKQWDGPHAAIIGKNVVDSFSLGERKAEMFQYKAEFRGDDDIPVLYEVWLTHRYHSTNIEEVSVSSDVISGFEGNKLVIKLPFGDKVSLMIYDVAGRLAESVYNGYLGGGTNKFDTMSKNSGVYFARLSYRDKNKVLKFIILK